jgi:hypothetical protein
LNDIGNEVSVPAPADHYARRFIKYPGQIKAPKESLMPAAQYDPAVILQMLS